MVLILSDNAYLSTLSVLFTDSFKLGVVSSVTELHGPLASQLLSKIPPFSRAS